MLSILFSVYFYDCMFILQLIAPLLLVWKYQSTSRVALLLMDFMSATANLVTLGGNAVPVTTLDFSESWYPCLNVKVISHLIVLMSYIYTTLQTY